MNIDPSKLTSFQTTQQSQSTRVVPQPPEQMRPLPQEKPEEAMPIKDELSFRSSYRAAYERLETEQSQISGYQIAGQQLTRLEASVERWQENAVPDVFNQEVKTLFSEMEWEGQVLYEDEMQQLLFDEDMNTDFQAHLDDVRSRLEQLQTENQENLTSAQEKLTYTLVEMENIEAADSSQNLQEVYEQLNELRQPENVHEQASPEALLNLLS